MEATLKDIFDVIAPEVKPVEFKPNIPPEPIDLKKKINELQDKIEAHKKEQELIRYKNLASELKTYIKEELSKVKITQDIVERIIEKQPIIKNIHIPVVQPPPPPIPAPPPQIIKEVRVEVPAKDNRKLVEEPVIEALKKEIEDLKKELTNTKRLAENPIVAPGGPGVIGIPAPEPNPDGYVLTISKGKAVWKVSTGGGGGTSSDIYSVSNLTADRSYDAKDTTVDELAAVLGSLIVSLQGAGIIQ